MGISRGARPVNSFPPSGVITTFSSWTRILRSGPFSPSMKNGSPRLYRKGHVLDQQLIIDRTVRRRLAHTKANAVTQTARAKSLAIKLLAIGFGQHRGLGQPHVRCFVAGFGRGNSRFRRSPHRVVSPLDSIRGLSHRVVAVEVAEVALIGDPRVENQNVTLFQSMIARPKIDAGVAARAGSADEVGDFSHRHV